MIDAFNEGTFWNISSRNTKWRQSESTYSSAEYADYSNNTYFQLKNNQNDISTS